jgi:hypothetical protein
MKPASAVRFTAGAAAGFLAGAADFFTSCFLKEGFFVAAAL